MKKIYPLLLTTVIVFFTKLMFAQHINSCLILEIHTPNAQPGETICVDVTARNFENLIGFQYTNQWNPADLKYLAIENFNLPGLDENDFGTTPELVDNGNLTVSWLDNNLIGQSLDDDALLYSICFEVLAPMLTFNPVGFSNSPTPYEFNALDSGSDMMLSPSFLNGGVSVAPAPNTDPVHVVDGCAQNADCMVNSLGSIDITVENGSMPYIYTWSGPNGFSSNEEDIANLEEGWYIVEVEDASGIQTTAQFQVGSFGMLSSTASTTTVYCGQGDSGSINLHPMGGSGDYSFMWSNGATTEDLQNLGPGDYFVTITDNANGCSTADSYTVIYEDFLWAYTYECTGNAVTITNAIWAGGQPPYTFEWSNGSIETNDLYSAITVPPSGEYFVTVTDQSGCNAALGPMTPDCGFTGPDVLTLYGSHHTAGVDEVVCMDVMVQNFSDIISTQFSINWDPTVAEFLYVQNFNLPELTELNFGLTDENEEGILRFSWIDPTLTGVSVEDNVAIFQVCYRVLNATEGTNISFTDNPIPIEIINVNLNPENYNTIAGSINVGDIEPEPSIDLSISDEIVALGNPVCVQVTAEEFTQVGTMAFDITWDTDIIDFDEVHIGNLPNLDLSNFSLDETESGILSLNWQGQNNIELPANTLLFELCYTAVGELDTSSDVRFADGAEIRDLNNNILPFNHSNGSVAIQELDGSNLRFIFSEENVLPDESVCVEVSVEDFHNVVAFQFPIHWDTSVVQFQGVQAFNLESLTEASFGLTDENDQGILRVSWLENTTFGHNLLDGTVIFQLCFQAVGAPGSSTDIFVNNNPIANEAVVLSPTGDLILEADIDIGTINITENFVWPGDADNNQVVNHFDLLPIGLGFNTSGPTRNDASVAWEAQNALNWLQQTPNSFINYKHLDTDGNGTINAQDTLAILQNWGQMTDNFSGNPDNNLIYLPPAFSPLNTAIYLMPDTLVLGETVGLDIILGEEGNPATNIYGLAFSIAYDTHAIVNESVFPSFQNSWLGDSGEDLIAIYRNDIDEGKIDIALTRTDGQNMSGSGIIGVLNITIEDVIIRSNFYEMEMEIKDVRVINAQEELKGITARKTTSLVELSTGVNDPGLEQKVKIFPVPVRDLLYFDASALQIEQIQIFSVEGQLLSTQYDNRAIPVKSLSAGTYAIRFITSEGVVTKRFVKAH